MFLGRHARISLEDITNTRIRYDPLGLSIYGQKIMIHNDLGNLDLLKTSHEVDRETGPRKHIVVSVDA